MRHGLFTLALAAALTACSKPNPLFLDTWEGLSEGASQITAVTTDDATATASSASSVDPTSTSTTTIDETTTAGPTATSEPPTGTTGSTGQACSVMTLDGVPSNNDTFLVRALPSGFPVCALADEEETFFDSTCEDLEFGQQPLLSVFNDIDPVDGMSPRFGYYILDFPRDDGGLLFPPTLNMALPTVEIEGIGIHLVYSNPSATEYDEFIVDMYAIPGEADGGSLEWLEGQTKGGKCTSGANLACSLCDQGGPPICAKGWGSGKELDLADMEHLGVFTLPGSGPEPTTATIELDRKYFGAVANRGFLLVPKALKLGGELVGEGVPPGPVRIHAGEFAGEQTHLFVKTCL